MLSKQTVYLTADRQKAVKEGDPKAQYLLVREGHEIAPEVVEKYEGASALIGNAKAPKAEEAKPAAPVVPEPLPATNAGPAPQNREDALPKLRTRQQQGKRSKR